MNFFGRNDFMRNFFKTKKIKDERITKETNSINLKAYAILQAMCVITLILKSIFGELTFWNIFIELFSLVGCNLYIVIRALILKINLADLIKGKDEFLLQFRNNLFSQAFYASFFMCIYSSAIYLFSFNDYIIPAINSVIFFIPGLYATYCYINYGLFIFKNKNKYSKTKFRINLIICSLLYGVFVSLPYSSSILSFDFIFKRVIFSAVLWGIPMYIAFSFMIKISEKNANKRANS